MWPFRRRREETLNEQLLREAGLDGLQTVETAPQPPGQPPPEIADPYAGTYPAQTPLGVRTRAMARPGTSDVLTTADAPGLPGDAVEFAALPDGDLVFDGDVGNADLSPLAEAVERELKPPYRAYARRQAGDLWGVEANAIDVSRFTFDGGDALELVTRGGETQLTVDDEPSHGTVPELEEQGRAVGVDYVVHAERLDGDLWEVTADPL
jgi:hypothetical protein